MVDAEDDWLMVELDMPFSRAGSARPHEVMETCYGLEGEELAGLEVEKVAVAWRDSKELG